MTPAKRDSDAKSAAEARLASGLAECRECGWSEVTDLRVTWVLGYPLILCENVWQCWFRQQDLAEHLATTYGQLEAEK